MNRKINEDCLVCIKKENNLLKVEYLEFDVNPLLKSKSFIKLTNLLDEDKSWEDTRDVGYEHLNELKIELTKYFHEEEVLISPNDAYARTHTIGQKTLFKKIPNKIKGEEAKYYIYQEDSNHQYRLSTVIDKLKLTFINYLYKEASLKAINNGYLAFSHRKFGWNTEEFKLDENFRINVDTNFGYGRSSYFTLTFYYNEIPIIPYTKVIYYPFVNASSLLNYTEDYIVDYESFVKCFRFVSREFNAFKQNGKDSFIYNHITQSLDELSFLIEKLMDRSLFYFVDTDKIDTYLDLNNRKIIYDYEYLIDNVNPQAINEKALRDFLKEYDKLTFESLKVENNINTLKMYEELSKNILNKSIKEDSNENFIKERYAYAIAILLSKYSDQNLYWKKLDDDKYNQNIQVIIKKILNIEQNYKILIHRKSGMNLMVFRNERIQLVVDMFKNLNGLSNLIDSNKYITKFRKSASLMMEQNNNYLSEIEPLLEIAYSKYLEDSTKFRLAKESFDKTLLSKQVTYYHELIKSYKNLVETLVFDLNKGSFSFEKSFENAFGRFLEHIVNFRLIESINFDKSFLVRIFGQQSYYRWSIKNLSDCYSITNSETDKQALNLMNNTIQSWYQFLSHFDVNSSNLEHIVTFNAIVSNINTSLIELSKLLKDNIDFKKSFSEFIDCFYNNHKHYSSIISNYYEAVKPINDLNDIAIKSESEFRKIENNKNRILMFNKQLQDKLKI
jgi:hypothetical protein